MADFSTTTSSDLRSSTQDYKRDAAHKHKWALGAQETLGRGEGNPRPQRIRDRGPPRHLIERCSGSVRRARRHAARNNLPLPEDATADDYPEHGYIRDIMYNVPEGYAYDSAHCDTSGGSSSDENAVAGNGDDAAAVADVPASPPEFARAMARADVDNGHGIMYSFDAARGPSQGSQILNVALAKAVERFEEKETVKLVRNEYDVLDSEGESVGLTPSARSAGGKAKGKKVAWASVAAGTASGAGKEVMPPVKVQAVDEDEEYEFV